MKKINRPLEMKNVKRHRREDCVHYEGCLEEASALLWPSFSCEDCKQFAPKRKSIPRNDHCSSPLAWEM
ncbi:MAG: hypothetical protein R6V85_05965 [Polyangia bacterium]